MALPLILINKNFKVYCRKKLIRKQDTRFVVVVCLFSCYQRTFSMELS